MAEETRPAWKPGDPLPKHPTRAELAAIAAADKAADAARSRAIVDEFRARGEEVVEVSTESSRVLHSYGTKDPFQLKQI
jgi:hypothetical protein